MASIAKRNLPKVHYQRREENEVLCSLMSSVFHKDIQSKRFDRNQLRDVSVTQRSFDHGQATVHRPHGPFQSQVVIVMLGTNLEQGLTPRATNRGHTVLNIAVHALVIGSEFRNVLATILSEFESGHQFFLCADYKLWLENIGSSQGFPQFSGIVLMGAPETPLAFQTQATDCPMLVIANSNMERLIGHVTLNPSVILVILPGNEDQEAASLQPNWLWLCRCIIEFAEAESSRQRFLSSENPNPVLHSKL